jgi:hypothetical protein
MAHWGLLRQIKQETNEKHNLRSYFQNDTVPVPKTRAASDYQNGTLSAHKT